LFLDDIDALPLDVQAKLLRVTEDREFESVGSVDTQLFKGRLVAATNKCLDSEVAEGRFRADLFHRLNVVNHHLPPLRERRDEIDLLAPHLASRIAAKHGFHEPEISPWVLDALRARDWPGNVRELRNVLERAMIAGAGMRIDLQHLSETISESDPSDNEASGATCQKTAGTGLAGARLQAEREYLVKTLERNNNNRSKTAAELGISRAALYKKLRKHALV
jgi:two-component system response regulator AtoC